MNTIKEVFLTLGISIKVIAKFCYWPLSKYVFFTLLFILGYPSFPRKIWGHDNILDYFDDFDDFDGLRLDKTLVCLFSLGASMLILIMALSAPFPGAKMLFIIFISQALSLFYEICLLIRVNHIPSAPKQKQDKDGLIEIKIL